MKKLLLLAITVLIAQTNLKAQIGEPYAPVGAKWTYLDYYFSLPIPLQTPTSETFYIEAVADTIIQNRVCSKMVFSGNSYQKTKTNFVEIDSIFFYHRNSRQVFRYDAPLDTFYLLYDFSLSIGDTFKIQLFDSFNGGALRAYNAIITDTSITNLNGQNIKGMKFDLMFDSVLQFQPLIPNLEVFEKLGFPTGPAYSYGAIVNIMGWVVELGGVTLRCYEDSLIGLYKLPGVVECDTSFNTSVRNNYEGKSMEIYPNPAQNQVRINLEQEINKAQTLYLRDISGKLVKTYSVTEPNQTLDIGGMAKGMYFVNIQGFRVEKLVIH